MYTVSILQPITTEVQIQYALLCHSNLTLIVIIFSNNGFIGSLSWKNP